MPLYQNTNTNLKISNITVKSTNYRIYTLYINQFVVKVIKNLNTGQIKFPNKDAETEEELIELINKYF